MSDLWLIVIAGFVASLVDGALGMGFGPTSSSLLLSAGVSPATTATMVNLAKVVTGAASALVHWRFANIDRRLVVRLAVPGALGALVGTTVLTRVDGDDIRPWLAVMLTLVGLRLLVRFSRPLPNRPSGAISSPRARRLDAAVAAGGGISNGMIGAWGPIVTPYLLHRGFMPRMVVGSVNTAEVAVAVVSAGSLLGMLGRGGVEVGLLLAMLGGGVAAAPLAAHVVRFVQPRLLGLGVAGLLLGTQAAELTRGPVPESARPALALLIGGLLAWAVLRPRLGLGRVPAIAPGSAGSPRVRVGDE